MVLPNVGLEHLWVNQVSATARSNAHLLLSLAQDLLPTTVARQVLSQGAAAHRYTLQCFAR